MYDAVGVDVYPRSHDKPLEFGYEVVEVVLHFEVLELLVGFHLDIDIVECVLECLFEGGPVPFICVCSSSGDASLEFFHLLFLPWIDEWSSYVGECCGNASGWIAHCIIVPIGELVDAEID